MIECDITNHIHHEKHDQIYVKNECNLHGNLYKLNRNLNKKNEHESDSNNLHDNSCDHLFS